MHSSKGVLGIVPALVEPLIYWNAAPFYLRYTQKESFYVQKFYCYEKSWGERIRTLECRIQIPMPYPLATPQKERSILFSIRCLRFLT